MKWKLPPFLKFYWAVLKGSFVKFTEREAFTYAASLAYYTIFSLPPMLLVILNTTNLFYDRERIRETIYGELSDTVGKQSAESLFSTLDRIGIFQGSWWASALSIGALLFTSTTVFITIQIALNRMYGVKPKPKAGGILKLLRDRLLSFALLLSIAFILIVSLVLNALISAFGGYLSQFLPKVSLYLASFLSMSVPFLITIFLFGLIFRYLPDVQIHWKDTLVGALVTSALFALGRYLISFYIANSQAANLYDAAGSVMVIMLWVFYASIIFLFGGIFTSVYIEEKRGVIKPNAYAVRVRREEVEEPAEAD